MSDTLTAADRLALNRAVHGEVLGKRVLSEEEMRAAFDPCAFHGSGYGVVRGERPIPFRRAEHSIIGGEPSFVQLDIPDYSGSWSAVRQVEDEIARRGLTQFYATALWRVMDADGERVNAAVAALRATAEQRMHAALLVVRAHSPSGAPNA